MKPISQIYSNYKIMPTLQKHQLRVAGVAKIVCEYFKEKVDTENVILTCLLHDMGNIIKSDLSVFPSFLEPEGLEYWQKVKDEYIQKYGTNEHIATEVIAKEIGIPQKAFSYLQQIGFSHLKDIEKSNIYELKICAYADLRVGPYGIISLEDRLADGRKRYAHKITNVADESFSNAARAIERQLFSKIDIKPEDITEEKLMLYLPPDLTYQLLPL